MLLDRLLGFWDQLTARLRAAGEYLPALLLRVILFWEFWEAGMAKFKGDNWFASIPWADWQLGFPFPFDRLGAEINWQAAMWGELIGSVAILLGLFTRFFAFALMIVTVVATAAVHWPAEWGSLGELWQGYAITAKGHGNYKLPLLYLIMFTPLLFNGAGKISLDFLLARLFGREHALEPIGDLYSGALVAFVLGTVLIFVMPIAGAVLLGLAMLLTLTVRLLWA